MIRILVGKVGIREAMWISAILNSRKAEQSFACFLRSKSYFIQWALFPGK